MLGSSGRLPKSGEHETVTVDRICHEQESPTGAFCGISPYTFDFLLQRVGFSRGRSCTILALL